MGRRTNLRYSSRSSATDAIKRNRGEQHNAKLAIIGGGTGAQTRNGPRCEIFCSSAIKLKSECIMDLILLCINMSILIKGPVWFVKISREVSPTQVALLSAFVANGRRWVEITCGNLLDRVPTKNNQHRQRQQRALLFRLPTSYAKISWQTRGVMSWMLFGRKCDISSRAEMSQRQPLMIRPMCGITHQLI